MSDLNEYEVLWPSGRRTEAGGKLAQRLDTLEGKVVCELVLRDADWGARPVTQTMTT